jgi:hypothetical protein
MSMYRQLWLAIIVSMLLALVGSLLASLLSARAYLEQQLSMKNADNAAALALSLSQQNPDIGSPRTGGGRAVRQRPLRIDPHQRPPRQADRRTRCCAGRPRRPRMVRAIACRSRAEPGEAQITNGWTQLGTVTLVSHSRLATRLYGPARRKWSRR